MDIFRKMKPGCVRVNFKIVLRLDVDFALKKNEQCYITSILSLFMKKPFNPVYQDNQH